MGYQTRYILTVLGQGEFKIPDYMYVLDEPIGVNNYDIGFIELLINGEPQECNWHGHEEQMKAFSTHFPDQIFLLDGDGENTGDIWRKFFKNGKVIEQNQIHSWPVFDPKMFDEIKDG